jgi:hypothetical protein
VGYLETPLSLNSSEKEPMTLSLVRSLNQFRIFGSVSIFSRIALRSQFTKSLIQTSKPARQ